jgi:hypothetical protein
VPTRISVLLLLALASCHGPAARSPAATKAPLGFWDEAAANHGNFNRGQSLLFFADGTWAWVASGFERLPDLPCAGEATTPATVRELAHGGTYAVEPDGTLALTTAWSSVLRGGADTGDATDCAVKGGKAERVAVEPPRVDRAKPEACQEMAGAGDQVRCIRVLGVEYGQALAAPGDPLAAYFAYCGAKAPCPPDEIKALLKQP